MKFGVLQFFSWPERRVDLATVYDRAVQRIEIMDRSGYDAVWLAEHHFSSFSVCPSVHMMGTLAAALTRRLRIGTAVSLAAFYHPLRLAEEVALLEAFGELWELRELLVEPQQEAEHIVVPDDKATVGLSPTKDLKNIALFWLLHVRELQRQIRAGAPQGACAPALFGLSARRGALDRTRQQGIESGADEELESFDGGERSEGGAGTQIGVFDDFVKTFVNALDRLPFRPLSIDDFLEIVRGFLERQHRIKLGGQALR